MFTEFCILNQNMIYNANYWLWQFSHLNRFYGLYEIVNTKMNLQA